MEERLDAPNCQVTPLQACNLFMISSQPCNCAEIISFFQLKRVNPLLSKKVHKYVKSVQNGHGHS